ncbi:MAG: hypothetical protein R2865_02725, partial [Deinococcales bacterium]
MHQVSSEDKAFQQAFETGLLLPAEFSHESHLRLAYIYLCQADLAPTTDKMRTAILNFLSHHAIDQTKYHETVTQAWLGVLKGLMDKAEMSKSAKEF